MSILNRRQLWNAIILFQNFENWIDNLIYMHSKITLVSWLVVDLVSAEHIPRESLLHFVARLGLYKVALFLLDKNGAQEALSLPNRHGYLPKDIAAEKGHTNLAALLTE